MWQGRGSCQALRMQEIEEILNLCQVTKEQRLSSSTTKFIRERARLRMLRECREPQK